ncbi:MAG: DASH family cryptochrome [Candidatus Pelagadaptatus aseana]|uniref:DASH family cryptochrome n=1 Tax=Candidatus Pelagadaptatus aseana TaxID=3120508 RepID=UPI0039B19F8D
MSSSITHKPKSSGSLLWFTQDLRLDDNPSLLAAAKSEQLLCVYVVDPIWFRPGRWQISSMGYHRWYFLQECLSSLNQELRHLGQQLYVCYGDTVSVLGNLLATGQYDQMHHTALAGSVEANILKRLKRPWPDIEVIAHRGYTLFDDADRPLAIAEWPDTYSRFRRQAEKCTMALPQSAPSSLPPMPAMTPTPTLKQPDWLPQPVSSQTSFQGGIRAAQQHLDEYFSGVLPRVYKDNRNALSGWGNSSKLSPWLNHGVISPRRICQYLRRYNSDHGDNPGTQWLLVELLWREFFHWHHHKVGDRLFKFRGLANSSPNTTFYPERWRKWCDGETPYPLVNACMKELKATGYLSNRGRQIAASCLINELGLDWRFGAAWFEYQLIDYDVSCNWGNWQYIAGVGVDPRGGRHFNLEKQTHQFDPDGHYRRRWGATANPQLDSTDMVDWPIESEANG